MLFVVVRNSNHNIQSSNLNVQRTRDSNHKVQSSNLNVQWIKIISVISEIRSWYYFAIMIRKIRSMYSNFFYILVNERVGERNKNVLFWGLCKYFILN